MAMPIFPVSPVRAAPLTGGLYAAATVQDTLDGRHLGGVTLEPVNAGASGRWATEPADVPEDSEKAGERGDWPVFPATVVWAADEAKSVGVDSDVVRSQADHIMRLREPIEVETFVAEQLAEFPVDTSVADFVHQVMELEEALSVNNHPGVIHARRGLVALAQSKGMVVRQGGALFTPGGHRWAFGVGYGALGDDLVGTGPVLVRRSELTTRDAFDQSTNDRVAVVERIVAVGWEAPTARVSVTPAP